VIADGGGAPGQLTRRLNPQIGQLARPVASSISRKLAHPLVEQNGRTAAAARRRCRRRAPVRSMVDVVVDRVSMMFLCCALDGPESWTGAV